MDTMHYWALWRLLVIALIASPLLVAALVERFLPRSKRPAPRTYVAPGRRFALRAGL